MAILCWTMILSIITSCQHHKAKWRMFLCDSFMLHDEALWVTIPDLITFITNWEAELDCKICKIWFGETWIHHSIFWHIQSCEVYSHVGLFVLYFTFCFEKTSRLWGVTRFTQPHVHMYMCHPYVISILYCLLEELQMRIFIKIP
jgi:hypothetical protein